MQRLLLRLVVWFARRFRMGSAFDDVVKAWDEFAVADSSDDAARAQLEKVQAEADAAIELANANISVAESALAATTAEREAAMAKVDAAFEAAKASLK
jgi:hypothetical protein